MLNVQFTMHEGMGVPHDFCVPLRTNPPETPERELVVRSRWHR